MPFRNESNLFEDFNSAEETCEYRAENEISAKDNAKAQEGLDIPGVTAAAMDDVHECDAAQDMDIQERIKMLNNDQRRIFNTHNDHLMHQFRHEHGECSCNALKPIHHMFVSGVGGTGKSFLIETIQS